MDALRHMLQDIRHMRRVIGCPTGRPMACGTSWDDPHRYLFSWDDPWDLS